MESSESQQQKNRLFNPGFIFGGRQLSKSNPSLDGDKTDDDGAEQLTTESEKKPTGKVGGFVTPPRKISSPPNLVTDEDGGPIRKAHTVHGGLGYLGHNSLDSSLAKDPLWEEDATDLDNTNPVAANSGHKRSPLFARLFGYGGHSDTISNANNSQERHGSEETVKKASLCDLLLQRGVFAEGFDVSNDEINILFNQK